MRKEEAAIGGAIYNNQAFGSLAAQLLRANMDPEALRTNAVLLKDEWKLLDDKVVDISRVRLVGAADLISRGLVLNITNGLGTTVLETQNASDMSAADLNMDAIAPGAKDRLKFDIGYLPLPIIFKDFDISARVLNASRRGAQPLDTRQAAIAAKLVAEKVEEILFTGASTYTFGGGVIYGYMDHPSVQTGSLTANWDATAADPLADILAMKQKSITAKHYGPWIVYIPTAYDALLDDDYNATYPSITIRNRIKQIAGIEDVKVADKLTANNVLLVEMSEDTVRMVIGMQPTTLQDEAHFGLLSKFKIMTIMVPQIFADQDGNCGIVLYS